MLFSVSYIRCPKSPGPLNILVGIQFLLNSLNAKVVGFREKSDGEIGFYRGYDEAHVKVKSKISNENVNFLWHK